MRRRSWLLQAPWTRAPLLLLARPGVALALAVAALVAALPAAAGPLFLSSAANATLAERTTPACPVTLGSQVLTGDGLIADEPDQLRAAESVEAAAASRVTGLGAAIISLVSTDVVFGAAHQQATVDMVGRDDLAAHLHVVSGGPGAGLWLPEPLAATLGLRPGDTLDLYPNPTVIGPSSGGPVSIGSDGSISIDLSNMPPRPPIKVPVVAVYRDLREGADDPYWCGISSLYRGTRAQRSGMAEAPIRDLVLTDTATMASIERRGFLLTALRIERPPANAGMTVPRALALASQVTTMLATVQRQLSAKHVDVGKDPQFVSALPGFATRADLVQRHLVGVVLPISAAGLLVGLVVVVAAGVFWARRRRTELAVLATFGATPRWLGVKAALEAWPALLIGSASGWALAQFLVGAVGPGHLVAADSRDQSVVAVIAVFVLATLVVGVAGGAAVRPVAAVGPVSAVRRRLAAIPWEVTALVAAGVIWAATSDRYMLTLATFSGTLVVIPPKLILVPMLGMVGLGLLGLRVAIKVAARRRRRPMSTGSAARLLYSRRIRYAAVAMAVLALITAVPVALAVYGGTATRTVSATLAAQAKLALGSDVVVTLDQPAPVPVSLRDRTTPVLAIPGIQVGDATTTLLAVDPATFARDAFLDDRLDGATLAQVVRPLTRTRSADGAIAALASAPIPSGTVTINPMTGPPLKLAVTAVPALPAGQGEFPVVIVDRDALDAAGAGSASLVALGSSQLWIRGDPAAIRAAVAAAGLRVVDFRVAADRYVDTYYQPVTYSFAYLAALSLFVQTVTMVGFLLYLESRLPTLRRGFVMLRSLGMRGGRQGILLVAELLTPFVVGTLLGLGLAATAVAVLRGRLNVDPSEQPGTVLSVPYSTIAGISAGVLLFTCVAVAVTHRRLARSRAGEVLREVG